MLVSVLQEPDSEKKEEEVSLEESSSMIGRELGSV